MVRELCLVWIPRFLPLEADEHQRIEIGIRVLEENAEGVVACEQEDRASQAPLPSVVRRSDGPICRGARVDLEPERVLGRALSSDHTADLVLSVRGNGDQALDETTRCLESNVALVAARMSSRNRGRR